MFILCLLKRGLEYLKEIQFEIIVDDDSKRFHFFWAFLSFLLLVLLLWDNVDWNMRWPCSLLCWPRLPRILRLWKIRSILSDYTLRILLFSCHAIPLNFCLAYVYCKLHLLLDSNQYVILCLSHLFAMLTIQLLLFNISIPLTHWLHY